MKNVGLIETIKIIGGKAVLLEFHIERLKTSLNKLGISISENEVRNKLEAHIYSEQFKSPIPNFRFRLEVTQLVNKNTMHWESSSMPLLPDIQLPLRITIYHQQVKEINSVCNLKNTDRTIYHQAQQFATENNYDTAIVLNENNTIADAPIFNLFMVKENTIFTPPLADAPVAGVFRQFLLQQNLPIQEQSITPEILIEAEEIFLTNAIRGIIEVGEIESKKLQNIQTKKIKTVIETAIGY